MLRSAMASKYPQVIPALSIVVAVAQNGMIGLGNRLLWHIPDDLRRFRALTMGHHLIMGRKTWDSIGRPLPGRVSVVLSRSPGFNAVGCTAVSSLAQALAACGTDPEIFVIGGGELYRQALPLASRLYVTHVHKAFAGDVTFPPIDPNEWAAQGEEEPPTHEANGIRYSFVNYHRRR